jgi:hypothetical protein
LYGWKSSPTAMPKLVWTATRSCANGTRRFAGRGARLVQPSFHPAPSGRLATFNGSTQDRIGSGLIASFEPLSPIAWDRISAHPNRGLPAPRPYPGLARPGRAWIKSGRYWIAYRTRPRLLIVAVFYETADIPGRI